MPRHFLTGEELSAPELDALLDRALQLKAAPLSSRALAGASVALIFQKPSTRTRVSFESGVHELGGWPLVLRADELQLSRGEALRDTAYVLSRHVAAIGVRTGPDAMLKELAEHSSVPVVNMLTALHHPCQALADLVTLREALGSVQGVRVAYVGDGNNVARSLALLGMLAGLDVAIASPPGYELDAQAPLPAPAAARGTLTLYSDPREAVAGAQAVYADVWVSMGDEQTAATRTAALADYKLDDALLDLAAPGAFAMHDLPAHPGEEISPEVLYGSRQRIWDQAENRRHAQKALLELLVSPAAGERRSIMTVETTAGERAARPRPGDELELEVESLAFGGEGVARLGAEGYVVFVAGAMPGDRVRATVSRRKRSYARAYTTAILRPSAERIPPRAQHPGVPWQVLPYERQLQVKQSQVQDALQRLGRLEGFELQEIVPAVQQWRYRNKLEYSFGAGPDGELVCGFHASGGWKEVVAIGDCLLASEIGNRAREIALRWCREQGLVARDRTERRHRSRPRWARAPAQPGRARRAAHRPEAAGAARQHRRRARRGGVRARAQPRAR